MMSAKSSAWFQQLARHLEPFQARQKKKEAGKRRTTVIAFSSRCGLGIHQAGPEEESTLGDFRIKCLPHIHVAFYNF